MKKMVSEIRDRKKECLANKREKGVERKTAIEKGGAGEIRNFLYRDKG